MDLSEQIKEFINDSSTSKYKYGNGYGYENGYRDKYGDGYGYGYGYGSGDGYGEEYGYGSGDRYGEEYGYGCGNGNGFGNGNGNGSGDGYGTGEGILSINKYSVIKIDNINTIVYNIKGNILKGSFIKNNKIDKDCYLVKQDNYFAHGNTLKEAYNALESKILLNIPIKDRIERFQKKFSKKDKKYKAKDFFDWHYKLTNSCEAGRKHFCKQNNINLETSRLTVQEFIDLTKNNYNGNIIRQLKY